jgi:hypothetical protein
MKKFRGALKFYWLCLLVLLRVVKPDGFLRWCRREQNRLGHPYRC